jgi:lipopolysaccharide heptosyltransferase I
MPQRILLVKLSSLGDVIHALPAAQAVRRRFPEAHLAWAVERAHAGMIRGLPWIDELIEWDRGTLGGLHDFVRRLRARPWDLAIDLQGLLRSASMTWLSGAQRRIGFAPGRERSHWFYNERVEAPSETMHAVDRLLRLVEPLGATFQRGGAQPFPLPIGDVDRAAVEAFLAAERIDPTRAPLVILNPHCRNPANVWPAAHFATLAGRLLDYGAKVVLTGGPVAREFCDAIAAAHPGRIIRADGKLSLLGSAELIRRAALFVTGDTGPMHIAAAVGAPIVALLGPTMPERTGPYASDAIVLRKNLLCSPCLARQCPLALVPPPCMNEISPDEVFAAAVRRLAESSIDPRRKSA